jgi:hypothetical protein
MTQIPKVLASTVAIVLLISGCGGGSGEEVALTKAQLVKQANAICEKTNKEQFAAVFGSEKRNPIRTVADHERLVSNFEMPPLESEAEELVNLNPPAAEGDEFQALTKGIAKAAAKVEEDPASLTGPHGTTRFSHVDLLIAKYGLTACSAP